jgi:hypothetical protein
VDQDVRAAELVEADRVAVHRRAVLLGAATRETEGGTLSAIRRTDK